MTVVLGIHDGHTATASLVKDGEIIASVSEERINRIKEWGGFPEKAIAEVLEISRLRPEDVDSVAVAGLIKPTVPEAFHKPYWWKRMFGAAASIVPKSILSSNRMVGPVLSLLKRTRNRREIREKLKSMGIDAVPVFYEHHLCHAGLAHYTCWHGAEENLILTCDGSGDAVSATVSIGRGERIERIASIFNYNSLGEFYTRLTQYLGMKPMSHEYKVMGLAPYAKEGYARKTYDAIKNFFYFPENEPLAFRNRSGCWKWGYIEKFKKLFPSNHRFDNIARAAQTLVENVLVRWVSNTMKETGIRNIVLSGGVFMNVKANLEIISRVKGIENVFIFPSSGDESIAMGAALLEYARQERSPKFTEMGPLYLGRSFSSMEIENEIEKRGVEKKYSVEKTKNPEKTLAETISEGKVAARFAGRMEWGARALGNRSIIADPRNPDIIRKINEAIKGRDFWMPFAPSILKERENDYLIKPMDIEAPYMVLAFQTKERARKDLRAALHPYDFTARPQVVMKDWNPGYHKLIREFEKLSGPGGILNTSFNLHGEPIVRSPEDAINTFENSGLDVLAMENYIIRK